MMLAFGSTCAYIRGTEREESEGRVDGVVDSDFTMSARPDAIGRAQLCFCPFRLGNSPSNSVDNSIIGSNLSTFTTGSTAGMCGNAIASVGGLHGISTVELCDWQLWIFVEGCNMESGSPYAL